MNTLMYGLRAWVIQRVSAVYLALFTVYLFFHFFCYPPADFSAWQLWLSNPWVFVASALFFVALLLHAWVGVRDVIIDYIHPVWLRFSALTLALTSLIVMGVWFGRVLLGVVAS